MRTRRKIKPRMLATITPTSCPLVSLLFVTALDWVGVGVLDIKDVGEDTKELMLVGAEVVDAEEGIAVVLNVDAGEDKPP